MDETLCYKMRVSVIFGFLFAERRCEPQEEAKLEFFPTLTYAFSCQFVGFVSITCDFVANHHIVMISHQLHHFSSIGCRVLYHIVIVLVLFIFVLLYGCFYMCMRLYLHIL